MMRLQCWQVLLPYYFTHDKVHLWLLPLSNFNINFYYPTNISSEINKKMQLFFVEL